MKREFLSFCKMILVSIVSVMLISVMSVKQAQSYYGGGLYGGLTGGLTGGLYGSSMYGGGMMGGMYGGLYGSSMYGGMMGGMYGGGMMGGLYGSSMYGGMMGGMYGGGMMGGMYGGMMGGMYGGSMMGGLYGSSMYGGMMGGMYGSSMYGGMYGGTSNPFSLQNMYFPIQTGTGLTYQVPFLQIAPLLGVAGLYNSLFPDLFNSTSTSTSGYGRASQQVIAALYAALTADPLLGPVLLADPVVLDILASDAVLAAVVAANSLWLYYHVWQVLPPTIPAAQPLLLSKIAVTCTQCHSNVNTGALLPVVPLPTQLI